MLLQQSKIEREKNEGKGLKREKKQQR